MQQKITRSDTLSSSIVLKLRRPNLFRVISIKKPCEKQKKSEMHYCMQTANLKLREMCLKVKIPVGK